MCYIIFFFFFFTECASELKGGSLLFMPDKNEDMAVDGDEIDAVSKDDDNVADTAAATTFLLDLGGNPCFKLKQPSTLPAFLTASRSPVAVGLSTSFRPNATGFLSLVILLIFFFCN